jgi:hypothetical protein
MYISVVLVCLCPWTRLSKQVVPPHPVLMPSHGLRHVGQLHIQTQFDHRLHACTDGLRQA